jgi:hypothetical protein
VRANAALRIKGQQHQRVLRQLGAAEKAFRRERNDSREREFVKVAKSVLTAETYMAIWAEVDASSEVQAIEREMGGGR